MINLIKDIIKFLSWCFLFLLELLFLLILLVHYGEVNILDTDILIIITIIVITWAYLIIFD